ncbi:hypothetical protein TRVL_09419 [Trypanosoma vivax]|uniref:Uncharacterized protein n=1 Tax=Trypanosoma vivax (strain Y486) TaxID=1055687 RepID=G0U9A1_TRYVY|nr:hypothetical protein TRVL_09419 [Trypanosoma vivax]CCC54186.1 conserved hypothetical protein [Trypanosoma vivax Y486]
MNLHSSLRIRLIVKRVSHPGVLSPSNIGMVTHALRQLGMLNVRDKRFLHILSDLLPPADLRSKANVFHCLACSVREQESVKIALTDTLQSLLFEIQCNLLLDVDDLSPTEAVLVMEGLVKLTPYCCTEQKLVSVLRSRVAALVGVVGDPVGLIGIARILVEAMQEPQPCSTDDLPAHGSNKLRIGHSEELREVCQVIGCRLDTFSKQDLITFLDAITLRIAPRVEKEVEGGDDDDFSVKTRHGRRVPADRAARHVPDECRDVLQQVLDRVRLLAPLLSSSQVSAWTHRLSQLGLQGHYAFTAVVQRLEDECLRSTMSASQLSTCVEALVKTLQQAHQDNRVNHADQPSIARVIVKLLESLLMNVEGSDTPHVDCSSYVLPALSVLLDEVSSARLKLPPLLVRRLFHFLYRHLGGLAPRERADLFCIVFMWGVAGVAPGHKGSNQHVACEKPREGGGECDVFSPSLWCSAIVRFIDSYNIVDAIQILNEVSAVVYAQTGNNEYGDSFITQPVLMQLHQQVQAMETKMSLVHTSHLVRYLCSMSKLGVRRKSDYYKVLTVVQQRELTEFERLRVLGVIARHQLLVPEFVSDTVSGIPQRTGSMQPQQKCLLLKFLGKARPNRFIRSPLHAPLELGTFLTEDELLEVPLLGAMCAFVGLVDLRQFANRTLGALLCGPLGESKSFADIRSAALLCEFVTALCRTERCLVPQQTLVTAIEAATKRLSSSRSFFVDVSEMVFWMRLLQAWDHMPAGGQATATEEVAPTVFTGALKKLFALAASIASARLVDIAESETLRPNTFLFSQIALCYQLGVVLPKEMTLRLSQNLDIKHLPRLLSSSRQVVNAAKTALCIASCAEDAAAAILHFVMRNFGSLSVQDHLVLGVELSEFLRQPSMGLGSKSVVRELHSMSVASMNDSSKCKKLSTQETMLGVHYGLIERH